MAILPAFLASALAVAAAASAVLRLDCGGAGGGGWTRDATVFSGGALCTYTAPPPAGASPDVRRLFSHCFAPEGDLVLHIPVGNGPHRVALGFSEAWAGARAGTRRFSVFVNDRRVARALDVKARAPRPGARVLIVAAARARRGVITIRLKRIPGRNNPFLSTLVVTGPREPCEITVDAGAADEPTARISGPVGRTYRAPALPAGFGVLRDLFATHRYTAAPALTYKIRASGLFDVSVLHAEAFFARAGQRAFDIALNGRVVRRGFDVAALAGRNRPLVTTFRGVPVKGFLTVAFLKRTENPFVSGIVLRRRSPICRARGAPVKFAATALAAPGGGQFNISSLAALTYGPDGRLYAGSLTGVVYALTVRPDLVVSNVCSKSVARGQRRVVYGVAFNPASPALELFYSTSVTNWRDEGGIADFAAGWQNGRVEAVRLLGAGRCFAPGPPRLVVGGLPVSARSHGVSALAFLPDGQLLVSVGSSTNGGVRDPAFGDLASGPLDGAVLTCPTAGTVMRYSTPADPATARVVGGGCRVYAPGVRNGFFLQLTTRGRVFAVDSGANARFGNFSTDCEGGFRRGEDLPDRLIDIRRGRCYGHPNVNRGQCVFDDPRCEPPVIANVTSVTTGVAEYRANTFGGALKGNLFLSSFAPGPSGRLDRVRLAPDGSVARGGFTPGFSDTSGIAVAEGPRGELLFASVLGGRIPVLKPVLPAPGRATELLSVMPARGPKAGGNKVAVHGFRFGSHPSVFFGNYPCTDIRVIDDTVLECIVPRREGPAQVEVRVLGAYGISVDEGIDYWYW